MSKISIKQLFTYPFKGLSPQLQESVYLKTGHGIPGDRAFTLMYQDATTAISDTKHIPWMKKQNFAMQNDWHALAALDCNYDTITENLTIKRKGIQLLVANTNTLEGRDRISTFFTGYLAASYPSQAAKNRQSKPLQLVGEYNKTRYPDREPVHISLVSQATIDNLSEIAGKQIDVRRFRPNLLIDGVSAWGEFDWIGKHIKIGSAIIEVTAPINRCLNIDVNPETGERDINLLALLPKHFQHSQTGVVAKIISDGNVANGDLIIPC
ncbi:MAG: MOSC domain-containing protein [Methylacidiphilales bacterium]|nr:MOSC domain-containing protein [Candidatus Methylacidiphilales bacterium]NJR15341.1 MOSC domain-containing protein [Calothrix sp. CSU_2_0]